MPKNVKRILLFVAAFFFIALGIVGLVLPVLQGILFLAIGIILLSLASPAAHSWIENHTRKWPRLHAFIIRIEKRIVDVIGR